MAEGAARAVELHLHTAELSNIIGARQNEQRAPFFLRRNLSYVESSRHARHPRDAPVLSLQLHAASGVLSARNEPAGLGQGPLCGGEAASHLGAVKDVIIAALCVSTKCNGVEGFVPLAARAMPVPARVQSALLEFRLPLGTAPGSPAPASGLAVVLVHQRSPHLATVVSMSCNGARRRSRGSASAGGGSGCKVMSPSVTADAAFRVVPSGTPVAYSVVPLRDLTGEGSRQEGPLARLDGVLTTHEPAPVGAASQAACRPPFPYLEFQPLPGQRRADVAHGGGGSSSAAELAFSYTATVLGGSVGRGQQAQASGEPQAGSKRKAEVLAGQGWPSGVAAPAGGGAEKHMQAGAAPPPLGQQEPLLAFYFCSYNGSRSVRAAAPGFRCPLSCCRGLRCHSYAGLQQHLQASHSYSSYHFAEAAGPGGELEIFLRCKPAWCDPQGNFLVRARKCRALEQYVLGTLLYRSYLQNFWYRCPRRQRRRRLGPWGRAPRDEEEELLEAAAEDNVCAALAAAEAALPAQAQADPSVSAAPSSSLGGTAATPEASGAGEQEAAPMAAAAAKPPPRRGKPAGGRGRGRGARGARLPPPSGLSHLTRDGRPKFYHARTCVAMTRRELLEQKGAATSESDGDLAEWQRDCRERLQEQKGLCPEQRDFMYRWNLFLHRQPLHADADLPAALRRFAAEQGDELATDGPLRRCLLSHLLSLWRFRLLSPPQLHELTSALPPLRM